MTSKPAASKSPAGKGASDTLSELSDAIESGAGLPAVSRAAARALAASVALIDRSSAVLAVAATSSAEEGRLLQGAKGVEVAELRVADAVVGELRYRPRGEAPAATVLRMVTTLLALELERSRSPDWASDEAAGEFVRALLARRVTDRGDIIARAAELGAEIEDGAGALMVRATPRATQTGDWRVRVMTLALRALRAASSGTLAALRTDGEPAEIVAIVPATDVSRLARAAQGVEGELASSLPGFVVTTAWSRWTQDPVDLDRAANEALLAANVAEAEGRARLAFEDTGSYRLLLPAMSEDPAELERFYSVTVAPLAAYDDQYETELVNTIEAYLDNDGNVTPTAEQLFTHRHTIRYRMERVKELSGHDITSTEGREKLGLGLKAMRVLGITPPRGPAMEPGAAAWQGPPAEGRLTGLGGGIDRSAGARAGAARGGLRLSGPAREPLAPDGRVGRRALARWRRRGGAGSRRGADAWAAWDRARSPHPCARVGPAAATAGRRRDRKARRRRPPDRGGGDLAAGAGGIGDTGDARGPRDAGRRGRPGAACARGASVDGGAVWPRAASPRGALRRGAYSRLSEAMSIQTRVIGRRGLPLGRRGWMRRRVGRVMPSSSRCP